MCSLNLQAANLNEVQAALKSRKYEEALQLLLPGVQAGDAESQRVLGEMYFYGQGVKQDKVAAFKWNLSAAEKGDRLAMFSVGYLYEKGDGVTASKSQAIEYYKKAAFQQVTAAKLKLGDLYRSNDNQAAKYWYGAALEAGSEEARDKLAAIVQAENEVSSHNGAIATAKLKEACRQACSTDMQRTFCEAGIREPSSCATEETRRAVETATSPGVLAAVQGALANSRQSAAQLANIHNQMVSNLALQDASRREAEKPSRESSMQSARTDLQTKAERESALERATQESQERAVARTQELAKLEAQRAKQLENDKIQSQSVNSNPSSAKAKNATTDQLTTLSSDNPPRAYPGLPKVVNTSWSANDLSKEQSLGWCAKWTKKIRDDFRDSKNELIAVNAETCSCKPDKNSLANSTKMLQSEYSCEFSYSYRQNVPGNSR